MNDKTCELIENLISYVYKNVYDKNEKLLSQNHKLLNDLDYVDLNDFKEIELLINESKDYIRYSNEAINYFTKTKDGFNQDTNLFKQKIKEILINSKNSLFEDVIKEQWVIDTINYHSHNEFKSELIRVNEIFKSSHRDEYLIYKNKCELNRLKFKKIECDTHFSNVCHILMELSDLGYLKFPCDKDGNFDRIAIANIFQNAFETGVSDSTIKDYIGSKKERTITSFENGIKDFDDSNLFKIPPAYRLKKKRDKK